jgi:outer membrane autotransporter protein
MAHIIAYGGYDDGALDLKLGAAYDFGTLRIARTITALGYGENDSQNQHGAQVFATGGYKIVSDSAMVEPYAGIASISVSSGAFAETGNVAALSGAAKSSTQTYSTLGLKAALSGMMLDDMAITPRIDLGWQHALGHVRPGQIVTYQNASQSFLVLGAPLGIDAAAVQFGFDLAVAPDVTLNVGYDGSFSSRVQNNAIRAGLSLAL